MATVSGSQPPLLIDANGAATAAVLAAGIGSFATACRVGSTSHKSTRSVDSPLRDRPAHRDFHIVGMRAEPEYVESLIHALIP